MAVIIAVVVVLMGTVVRAGEGLAVVVMVMLGIVAVVNPWRQNLRSLLSTENQDLILNVPFYPAVGLNNPNYFK